MATESHGGPMRTETALLAFRWVSFKFLHPRLCHPVVCMRTRFPKVLQAEIDFHGVPAKNQRPWNVEIISSLALTCIRTRNSDGRGKRVPVGLGDSEVSFSRHISGYNNDIPAARDQNRNTIQHLVLIESSTRTCCSSLDICTAVHDRYTSIVFPTVDNIRAETGV